MTGNVQMVIGSWGSYNDCNERALGSKWLDLSDYTSWEEIEKELEREGFELNGTDEELFVQDCEGILGFCGDSTHPKEIFETCLKTGILNDVDKHRVATAYLEVRSWSDFKELVDKYGTDWDRDITLYENMTVEEVLEEMIEDCYSIDFSELGWLGNYVTIDYEAMARDSDNYYEVASGTLKID